MTNPSFTAHQYLSVLFDPNEPIWAGSGYYIEDENRYGVPKMTSMTQEEAIASFEHQAAPNGTFLCINTAKELGQNRAAVNVSAYRNFLVEFDDLPLVDQYPAMDAAGLPYSAVLWSGGKSFHFIISLEEPLGTRELYKQYFERLMICSRCLADSKNKDVSRLSRFPNAARNRQDATRATQQVCDIRGRVKRDELINILFSPAINQLYAATHPIATPRVKKTMPKTNISLSELNQLIANVFTKYPLSAGDKHHILLSCALALCHLTDLDDAAIAMELADHDHGDHRVEAEYRKAIETARGMVGSR